MPPLLCFYKKCIVEISVFISNFMSICPFKCLQLKKYSVFMLTVSKV